MKQKTRLPKRFLTFIVGLAFVGVGTPAWAQPVTFFLQGVLDLNLTAQVNFEYLPTSSMEGSIAIDIMNTSLPDAGPDPRITAFAFNLPTEVGFDFSVGFTGPPGWSALFSPNNINTSGQFGLFDIAGITGPDYNGGDPNDGVPRLEEFSFTFGLEGSGLDGANTDSFLTEFSFDPPGPPPQDPQFFIARFQRTGADQQGSDEAIPGEGPPPPVIPEPGTLLLIGSGLVGLGAGAWRRKKH